MPSLGRPGENAAGSSKGYRNGTYPRDLVTSTGLLEDINVPEIGKGSSTPGL
jgi:hypothetical protein